MHSQPSPRPRTHVSAQPATFLPPTPASPPVRRTEFHNHAQVHKDAEKRTDVRERLNNYADARLPTLRPPGGGRVNVRSEPRKVGGF